MLSASLPIKARSVVLLPLLPTITKSTSSSSLNRMISSSAFRPTLKCASATSPPRPRIDLGDNDTVRQALISRDIDMYWEYTATAWLVHLAQPDPISDPQEQYERVAERDLEENGVEWLERAPGNNTYAIAASEQTLEEIEVETISDLVRLIEERPEEATLCYGNEDDFSSRADGLPGLEEAYDFEYPEDRQIVVSLNSVYENVRRGERCNCGVVFTTNGQIQEMKRGWE